MQKRPLTREEKLAKLAADNDCVVTLAQLRQAKYSKQDVETAVSKGVWQRLYRGVYLLSAGTPTWRQQVRATMLAAGAEAQLMGPTLAAWAGLDGASEGAIHVVVKYGNRRTRENLTAHRTRHLSKRQKYDGLWGTSAERMLVDYAAAVSTDLAEQAVECALRKGLTAEQRIWRELATLPEAVPGVRELARIMELRPKGKAARSTLEIDTLNLIRRTDLPMPMRNYDVWVEGEHFEIDLAYLGAMGAIEVDSKRWHTTATQRAKDKQRQGKLEADGWSFVRVTSVDVYGRPEWVIEQIRDLLLTPHFDATERAS
jgi:restriction endonuclease-like protein/putative AbiEi antitoxin of type IV toxin-antitoxin system